MQIGFTSTSFRQIKDIEKIVRIATRSGAECIEWGADVHVKDVQIAKRAKQLCYNAGITISSYGSYYRVGSKNADEWKRICEIASAIAAKSIRVWLGNCDSEITYLCCYAIFPSSMKKSIEKIKAKVGAKR